MIGGRRHIFLVLCLALAALAVSGCEKLPGQKRPFALGPLRFGMTVEEMKNVFAGRDMQLDNYDTPLGQTWSVMDPFAEPPAPDWLTGGADRLALSFWDERLYRVRLHYELSNLADLLDFKKRFDRGYRFVVDQSQGEQLFLEYEAPEMKVFLTGSGEESGAVSFVDLPAFRAMDAARKRWQKQAADSFELEGLKFGMGLGPAEEALGRTLAPSDFFTGMENRRWADEASGREWELGFDAELGLAAIAVIYRERRAPEKVQERLFELTKNYGQGEARPGTSSQTVVIDAGNLRVSLIVLDCNDEGCLISEGWLWAGPEL